MESVIESSQSHAEICFQFEALAQRLGLSVLAVHDLGENRGAHGRGLDEASVLYSLVSWPVVDVLLAHDPSLTRCLPWRCAVYTRCGASWLAFQSPQLPPDLPHALSESAAGVSSKLQQLANALR